MTLKVIVDVTAIPQDRGGVGRYLDGVLPALGVRDVQLLLVAQPHDVDSFSRAVPAAEVVAAPAGAARRPVRLAWEQTGLPHLVRRWRADVVHSPHYTMPLASPVPVVVTVHDATFFTDPGVHSPVKARFFRNATRVAGRCAAALIAPSEATRDEVAREAGVAPGRVHVARHGVDTTVFRPPTTDDRNRVAASLDLAGRRYVAFLGTIEPRKNVPALIGAWVDAVRDLADPPALVLAGGRGWDDRVDAAVAAVPDHLTVVRPGYLPLDDLPGLLGGAEVVAYPSLGEGFGLPVLEAMACRATVLTTDRLALPEVGGDAVAYTGTGRAEIAAALASLLADPAERERLANRALVRAGSFTWGRAADVHLAAYQAAAVTEPWWRRRGARQPGAPGGNGGQAV
jgi:glycosyltransferase involved in cell wall biosynthesis